MLGDWLHLTMRQVEVARLMCVGLGNSEPADALETTPDTVRIRRWVLFGKSNVDDRVGVPVQPVLTARKLSKRKGR